MDGKLKTIFVGILLVIAVAIRVYDAATNPSPPELTGSPQLESAQDRKEGRYFVLEDCVYVPDEKYNDGDSFKIKTSDGRVVEIRMYFVDAAESKDKPYDDYRRRVADQGKDFGGLDYQETIRLGREAKKYAASRLRKQNLTVFTAWEEVYDSGRYYAFVRMENGKFWHQELVEKGLARIHTKGADLPGGTDRRSRENELRRLEQKAKRARIGGWGY